MSPDIQQLLSEGPGGDDAAAKLENGMGAGGLGPSPQDAGMAGPVLANAGTPGKLPNMPDWAGWMPWDVADATQNQDMADEFGKQAIAQMADTWGDIALREGQDALNKALAAAQQRVGALGLSGPGTSAPAATTPDLSQQSGTAAPGGGPPGESSTPEPAGTSTAAPETMPAAAGSQASSPEQHTAAGGPSLQDLLTAMHGFFSNGSQAVGQTASNLGDAAQNAMSNVTGVQANAPVGPENEGVGASAPAIQGAVQGAPGTALNAGTDPLSAGVNAINAINTANGTGQPPVPTPQEAAQQGLISPGEAATASLMGNVAAAGPEALAAPAAGAVDVAKAGAAGLGDLATRGAAALGQALPADMGGSALSGFALDRMGVPAMAGAASDAFDMSHPLVQRVADAVGPEQAQQAVDVLNNPARLQRILKAPSRINSDTDQIAYQIYRGSKDAAIMQAVAAGNVPSTAHAVVDAVVAHNPDPALQTLADATGADPARRQAAITTLMKSKQFSTPEAASVIVDRLGPDAILGPLTDDQQSVLGVVGELPSAPGDAVVRDAARTALEPIQGPAIPRAETPLVGAPPIPTPTGGPDIAGLPRRTAPVPYERPPLTPNPIGEPPVAAPDAAFAAPPAAPPGDRITTGGGAPPSGVDYGLQPGQTPGGTPPASGPSALGAFARNSIPGLISGTASAGTVWTQDQDDALWRRLLLTGLAFKVGSAVPYGALGGPREGMAGRFFQGFANNLLGPNVAALKGATDVTSLVTDPAFNFVRSMVRGNGLQSSGAEGLAYYQSLLKGNGLREGLDGAASALNPLVAATGKGGQAAAGNAGLSELTSSNNLRLINAIQKFWEPIMANAEQAGMNAAGVDATGVERTFPQFLPQDVGRVTDTATARVRSGMMMGEPEGVVGRALLPIFQGIQRMGSAGKFVEPFATIPANLIDRGVSSMPLVGAFNAIGANAPDAVIARTVLGTTAAMLTRSLFQTTGAGPSDPTAKSAWLKEGNQPYSVKLPWTNTWVPINRIPILPLRGALTFDAALNDVKLNGAPPELAAQFATSYGRSLADDVFIPQIIQLGMALQQGNVSGLPSTVAGTVRMLLPLEGRLLAKSEQTVKPDVSGKPYRPAGASTADKVTSAVEAQTLANTPRGLGLPAPQPALTNSGQTEPNVQSGASVLSPLAPTRPTDDPVQDAFGQAGINIPLPPTTLAVAGKNVPLTGEQTQRFNQVRGDFLASHLPANPTPTRLQSILDQARSAAELDFARNNQGSVQAAPTSRQTKQQAQTTKAADWASWGANQPGPPPIQPPAAGRSAATAPAAPAPRTTNWGSWGK